MQVRVSVPKHLTCPNCWESFPSDTVHYVAESPRLRGDELLGEDAALRFLPSRFQPDGSALDAEGFPCQQLACPRCHLTLPRSIAESSPLFLSIVGAPASGKSFLLTAMSWRLRSTLAQEFGISFVDADPLANAILNEYEAQQFADITSDRPVKLEKTQERGHAYRSVVVKGQVRQYPQPFLFAVKPSSVRFPDLIDQRKKSRLVCLYDNAGESFQPGRDSMANPVTRHLAKSKCLIFLADPTQDIGFRASSRDLNHPQIQVGTTCRQDVVLNETAERLRRLSGLRMGERIRRPVIICVTKYDVWQPLLGMDLPAKPWHGLPGQSPPVLRIDIVQEASRQVHDLLSRRMPEFVHAVDAFAEHVTYVPVTATGCPPVTSDDGQVVGFRPKEIRPFWVEVPMLLAIACERNGLIELGRPKAP